jgi:hypothetical protein
MCEKCVELDVRIDRYRRIALSITDQLTIDRIGQLMKDLAAEKAKHHPNQKE